MRIKLSIPSNQPNTSPTEVEIEAEYISDIERLMDKITPLRESLEGLT
jgi:hypothetical protein